MGLKNFFDFGIGFGGGDNGGYYFRDAVSTDDADVVLVSVPWAVTSANGSGAAYAPDAIIDASTKVGLYDVLSGVSIDGRVATAEVNYDIQESSQYLGGDAAKIVDHVEDGGVLSGDYFTRKINRINDGFRLMNSSVCAQVWHFANKGKRVGVIGGDHSVSFGAVKAMSELHPDLGVLVFDAHCDLRQSGNVFDYSHLSVVRNMLEEIPQLKKVVCVGVRDLSAADVDTAAQYPRLTMCYAEQMKAAYYGGKSWREICNSIVEQLPQHVYISFDIDALSPEHCPHTKSSVAGGLLFDEAMAMIMAVVESGREIVGFDITEIVPEIESSIDASVGARLLVKLSAAAIKSGSKRNE